MPNHTLRSLRVLIVDDDPLIRTTFAEQLDSQRAITVVAAASGGLESAEDGDITAQAELFADVEEKDGQVGRAHV